MSSTSYLWHPSTLLASNSSVIFFGPFCSNTVIILGTQMKGYSHTHTHTKWPLTCYEHNATASSYPVKDITKVPPTTQDKWPATFMVLTWLTVLLTTTTTTTNDLPLTVLTHINANIWHCQLLHAKIHVHGHCCWPTA